MASITRLMPRSVLLRNLTQRCISVRIASISTSKKDKDTSITTTTTTPKLFEDGLPEKFDARVTNKHWVSWGYDFYDREKDATFVHLFFFMFISLCLVSGSYYIMYAPARNFRDWAQREAYLQIRRREELGLPYIDRDLIPAENIQLPSDEELGNTEIII